MFVTAFFLCVQLLSVFVIFNSISSLVSGTMDIGKYIFMGGQFTMTLGIIVGIMAYTDSIEKAYEALKTLEMSLMDRLVHAKNKNERHILKSQIKKVEKLGPMTACGYFTIDKSTLTGMLSVRYVSVCYDMYEYLLYYFIIFSVLLISSFWFNSDNLLVQVEMKS